MSNQRLIIANPTSVLVGSLAAGAAKLAIALEGRKVWSTPSKLRFETSEHNIGIIRAVFPSVEVEDRREANSGISDHPTPETPSAATPARFRMTPLPFQLENFERFKDQPVWAIFSEQGTGKTKVAFDIISHRFETGQIDAVIVLSSPKGVHAQWIESQMPRHMWEGIHVLPFIWDGKPNKLPFWFGRKTPRKLQFISGNIDMVRGRGFDVLMEFAQVHRGRFLIIVDESDAIKNMNSQRHKALRKIAAYTRQRGIMSGTPIAKDLTDEFSQFYFLDPAIIGHKYLTSFRSQFCIMGGFENRAVVGHKNLDQFKAITKPYIFRATKADLGLPPKIYDEVVFDMTAEQRRLIKEIREQFYATLDPDNEAVSVQSGAVALLRIQQISNGFAKMEDGSIRWIDNPRMDALKKLREDIQGPVVIWCRFQEDVEAVHQVFHNSGVRYYGPTGSEERKVAKEAFIRGDAREFIATAGAAGKGIDGLQHVCTNAIYYSNSFNAIDRWQSEDRIDRMGSTGSSSYFDLIGRGSADRGIIRNLKHKKSISDLALGEMKVLIDQTAGDTFVEPASEVTISAELETLLTGY